MLAPNVMRAVETIEWGKREEGKGKTGKNGKEKEEPKPLLR